MTDIQSTVLWIVIASQLELICGQRPSGLALSTPFQGIQNCSGQYGLKCADCDSLWVCAGGNQPVIIQNCEDSYPGRPYCENNECVSSVPRESACAIPLRCTGKGYFPDPTNCSQYFQCDYPKRTAKISVCPPTLNYNSIRRQCQRSHQCTAVDCTSKANRFVAFPANPIFYTFCSSCRGKSNPVVFRCPNENLVFDNDLQECVFRCPRAGQFADRTDPTAYFECIRNFYTRKWIQRRNKCSRGQIFDGYRKVCRTGTLLDSQVPSNDGFPDYLSEIENWLEAGGEYTKCLWEESVSTTTTSTMEIDRFGTIIGLSETINVSEDCSGSTLSVRCTGRGFFPGSNNCAQYFYCEYPTGTAKICECPPTYTYNSTTNQCQRKPCTVVDCSSNPNRFVAIPDNPMYYTFCWDCVGQSSPLVFRCPNDNLNHMVFDDDEQKCVFKCLRAGRFIDITDPNAYFECLPTFVRNQWYQRRLKCLPGRIFDGNRKVCRPPGTLLESSVSSEYSDYLREIDNWLEGFEGGEYTECLWADSVSTTTAEMTEIEGSGLTDTIVDDLTILYSTVSDVTTSPSMSVVNSTVIEESTTRTSSWNSTVTEIITEATETSTSSENTAASDASTTSSSTS